MMRQFAVSYVFPSAFWLMLFEPFLGFIGVSPELLRKRLCHFLRSVRICISRFWNLLQLLVVKVEPIPTMLPLFVLFKCYLLLVVGSIFHFPMKFHSFRHKNTR